MQKEIQNKLKSIEKKFDVEIIYACESGSRAWGFASRDSDYDVRMIYCHKQDWYLSLEAGRDCIELPLGGLLDISGWDIKKTLLLLHKANPTLLEWLKSPIVYKENKEKMKGLRKLALEAFCPKASVMHYLNMADNNMRTYITRPQINIKKYFYVLRPLLCAQWIIEVKTQPPLVFSELVKKLVNDKAVSQQIDKLLEYKTQAVESDEIAPNKILNHYIDSLLKTIKNNIPATKKALDIKKFDKLFFDVIGYKCL